MLTWPVATTCGLVQAAFACRPSLIQNATPKNGVGVADYIAKHDIWGLMQELSESFSSICSEVLDASCGQACGRNPRRLMVRAGTLWPLPLTAASVCGCKLSTEDRASNDECQRAECWWRAINWRATGCNRNLLYYFAQGCTALRAVKIPNCRR